VSVSFGGDHEKLTLSATARILAFLGVAPGWFRPDRQRPKAGEFGTSFAILATLV
jgi:hypothetical protein